MAERDEKIKNAKLAIDKTIEAKRQAQHAANQPRRDFLERLWDEPTSRARRISARDEFDNWNQMLHLLSRMEDQWSQVVQHYSSNEIQNWEISLQSI